MSSRNVTLVDFEHVMAALKSGPVKPAHYISNRVDFDQVGNKFKSCLAPARGVIKAMAGLSL